MRKYIMLMILAGILSPAYAQYDDSSPEHGNEYGAGITIAMSGFGFGGFYRIALPGYFHAGANIDFYIMRDENEFTGYNIYGYPVQFNKFNRLFLIPVGVELKKRLFQNDIEDGFRPYFLGMGGITFGMNFPRNNQFEIQNLPPEERAKLPSDDEFRLTFNFAIGFGIDVTTNENFFLSIRPQYRIVYFPESIAGKNNHSNFEIRMEVGKRNIVVQ